MNKKIRVLVTGSEGSLMQAVIPELINNEGYDVVGIDKRGQSTEKEMPYYHFKNQDLLDFSKPIAAGPVDMVIHAAASIYGVGGFNAYPADILGNDTVITKRMLDYAVKENAKFVYLSSSMVYERCSDYGNGNKEEDVFSFIYPVPFTDYGLSKFVGERMVRAYNRQYGLKYVTWRPFNIITPYEMAKGEIGFAHVFADFVKAIVTEKKQKIPIFLPGHQARCYTWIYDVSRAISENSWLAAGEYNIGSTEMITMKDLATRIWKLANRKGEIEFDWYPPIENDVMFRKPNTGKIQLDFDWFPDFTLDMALKKVIEEAENRLK